MKSNRLKTLLYGIGALLILSGAVIRIGHMASASVGFTFMVLGFCLGSIARILNLNRMRQL